MKLITRISLIVLLLAGVTATTLRAQESNGGAAYLAGLLQDCTRTPGRVGQPVFALPLSPSEVAPGAGD